MSLPALFARFTLVYVAALIGIAVVLGILGIKSSEGANTAALFTVVMWSCLSAARKRGSYLSRQEQTRAVLGMLVIDLALQLVVGLLAWFGAGALAITAGPAALVLVVVGLCHALVIYFAVRMTETQYLKGQEKATALAAAEGKA